MDGRCLTKTVSVKTELHPESDTVKVTVREVLPEPTVFVLNVYEGD